MTQLDKETNPVMYGVSYALKLMVVPAIAGLFTGLTAGVVVGTMVFVFAALVMLSLFIRFEA